MANPIPVLQPGALPDLTKPPVCATCGAVGSIAWGAAPPGKVIDKVLGFVPDSPHPLEGWTHDHISGGAYCPAHPAPKFKPDPEAALPDTLKKIRWWPKTDAEVKAENKALADAAIAQAAAGK